MGFLIDSQMQKLEGFKVSHIIEQFLIMLAVFIYKTTVVTAALESIIVRILLEFSYLFL